MGVGNFKTAVGIFPALDFAVGSEVQVDFLAGSEHTEQRRKLFQSELNAKNIIGIDGGALFDH